MFLLLGLHDFISDHLRGIYFTKCKPTAGSAFDEPLFQLGVVYNPLTVTFILSHLIVPFKKKSDGND